MHRLTIRAAFLAAVVVFVALVTAAATHAVPPSDRYTVTPLVSDVPGVAPLTDPNLVNAWGLARSATSPWWVADNETMKTTVYNGAGALVSVGGLAFQTVPGNPTGAVFSGISGQFQVGTTASPTTLATSNFLFDSEDGTISAWRGGSTGALVTVDRSPFGAIYKGLAISNGPSGPRLYATDFHNARVDVFNGGWQLVTAPGAFVDPKLPDGYAPFGIQTIGSRVFVTYGKQGEARRRGRRAGSPASSTSYDLDGAFLDASRSHGLLNAPWGLAQAPADWGAFGGDLLVGNFGDGTDRRVLKENGNGTFATAGHAAQRPRPGALDRRAVGARVRQRRQRTARRAPSTSPPARTTRVTGCSARSPCRTKARRRGGAGPPRRCSLDRTLFSAAVDTPVLRHARPGQLRGTVMLWSNVAAILDNVWARMLAH